MKTEQHTPGPWETIRDATPDFITQTTIYAEAGGIRVATAFESAANARLIAAAPDLISELKNLRRAYVNLLESGRDRILLLGGQCDDVATMEAADPNLRKTDAAIKKAEGQS